MAHEKVKVTLQNESSLLFQEQEMVPHTNTGFMVPKAAALSAHWENRKQNLTGQVIGHIK